MKYTLSLVGLGLFSMTLVLGCGKQEEPTKAQKPLAKQQKHHIEHKEPAKHEHDKPEPTGSKEKHGQKSELNQALQAYFAKTGDDPKNANPHQTTQIDLNSDGRQDALVLLQNPYWCGTGGCTMLVFKGTKSGFEFVSRSSLIRSPVLVSETKTHGWRDLLVEVSGGGATPKKVALKYTGSKYPLNPSTQPPLPKDQQVKGTKAF
jgi:putative lipoprotein